MNRAYARFIGTRMAGCTRAGHSVQHRIRVPPVEGGHELAASNVELEPLFSVRRSRSRAPGFFTRLEPWNVVNSRVKSRRRR